MAKKKTTSRKRADNLITTVKKLLEKSPVNKDQIAALKKLAKSLTAFERSEAAVTKAQEKADAAKLKVKAAAENFRAQKTPAGKRAVERTRAAAATAATALATVKLTAREKAAQVKEDIAAVVQAEKKEIAKNKAIATFTAQWEKRYDRLLARKAKKKAARQKASMRKKRSTKAAKTVSEDSAPAKPARAVKAKTTRAATAKKAPKTAKAKAPRAAAKTRTSRAAKSKAKARATR